jgi:ABC-type dipeptide/oligopeptide/nickel transport system permease subunit
MMAPVNHYWQRLKTNGAGMTGLVIVTCYLLIAIGVWTGFMGQDWSAAGGERWKSPDEGSWFGTNLLGQDIFQRSIFSVRTAFEVGLTVSVFSTIIGAVMGAIAGWNQNTWLDGIVLWLSGVLDSIPFYLFVAAVAFALQGVPWAMHIAMIATFWTTTGRLVRAEVMKIKSREFILSAQAIGLPGALILLRHVLPNTLHILLIQSSIAFVAAIKTEVILSFLGLGVQDGVSWGLMLAESTQEVLAGHFNNFLAASIMLFALLLGFNLLSDALQDAFDPKQAAL